MKDFSCSFTLSLSCVNARGVWAELNSITYYRLNVEALCRSPVLFGHQALGLSQSPKRHEMNPTPCRCTTLYSRGRLSVCRSFSAEPTLFCCCPDSRSTAKSKPPKRQVFVGSTKPPASRPGSPRTFLRHSILLHLHGSVPFNNFLWLISGDTSR